MSNTEATPIEPFAPEMWGLGGWPLGATFARHEKGITSFAVFAAEQEPLSPVPAFTVPGIEPVTVGVMREQTEADWLLGIQAPLTTASDAAGGCDGVKIGR